MSHLRNFNSKGQIPSDCCCKFIKMSREILHMLQGHMKGNTQQSTRDVWDYYHVCFHQRICSFGDDNRNHILQIIRCVSLNGAGQIARQKTQTPVKHTLPQRFKATFPKGCMTTRQPHPPDKYSFKY